MPIRERQPCLSCAEKSARRLAHAACRKALPSLLVAALTLGGVGAWAKGSLVYWDFGDTEFDRIFKKNRFNAPKYIKQGITPYFKKFCHIKNYAELNKSGFECNGKICKTTRTEVIRGMITTKMSYTKWHVYVDFNTKICPDIILNLDYKIIDNIGEIQK